MRDQTRVLSLDYVDWAALDSRDRKVASSPIVLISRAGKITVAFFPRRARPGSVDSEAAASNGGFIIMSDASPRAAAACFTFYGNDFRLLLALGLARHRPLHAVRWAYVVELHQRDLNAPLQGGGVEYLADVGVDHRGLGARWTSCAR